MNGIRDYFFFLFFGLSHPVLARNNAGIRFFNFFFSFLKLFSEFSSRGRVCTEFGTKIFFVVLTLSHPVLAKNNAGKTFLNFLNFFAFFFGIFFPEPSMNGNRDNFFFFFSFSAYLSPFWLKIMPERAFLIF